MADKTSNYEEAGYAFTEAITGRPAEEGEIRPLVKCLRCGSLVHGGGLSREKHDDFHTALANLFDSLVS